MGAPQSKTDATEKMTPTEEKPHRLPAQDLHPQGAPYPAMFWRPYSQRFEPDEGTSYDGPARDGWTCGNKTYICGCKNCCCGGTVGFPGDVCERCVTCDTNRTSF